MTAQPRIDELKRRHASLEQAIEGEAHRPSPDEAAIAQMKKQKLALKDEITTLETG
ncbi:MAG: YdcH family protein [Alphaproteobacteria bacterium]|nr:YdcH family protein [Alphaproteobacteria bacterium]